MSKYKAEFINVVINLINTYKIVNLIGTMQNTKGLAWKTKNLCHFGQYVQVGELKLTLGIINIRKYFLA